MSESRFHIATVCNQWMNLINEYNIGIELDQFCTAENMEPPNIQIISNEIMENINIRQSHHNLILHAPFNELFPAAIDYKARTLAMERLNQAYKIAGSFNIDKMVVHSGYMPFVYFKEWHIEKSVIFWNEFMQDKPESFNIAIENVLDDEPYMMIDMIERINNPHVGLCLDTGHANCMSKIPVNEWMSSMSTYINHIHIHNNDGSHDYHSPLADGTINMDNFIDEALTLMPHNATLTLECIDCHSSLEWLHSRGYI